MQLSLFDDFTIEVDPRILECGGSWGSSPKSQHLVRGFHRQICRVKPRIMVDIGACMGNFTMLAKFHPDMHVYAFEPNPEMMALLIENVRLNSLQKQVTALPFALFNESGPGTLRIPKERKHVGGAVLGCASGPLRFPEHEEIPIEMRTLDSFPWPQGIDIIKIDVEGAEKHVLESGETVIRRWLPPIMLESFKPSALQFRYRSSRVTGMLRSWGYKHFCGAGSMEIWAQVKPCG